jgi:hypothetical protein
MRAAATVAFILAILGASAYFTFVSRIDLDISGVTVSVLPVGLTVASSETLSGTTGPELAGRDLRGMNAEKAVLINAMLRGADLAAANLTHADLRGADMAYADLRGADMTHIKLTSAGLQAARLGSASLTRADLTAADLSGARMPSAARRPRDWRAPRLCHDEGRQLYCRGHDRRLCESGDARRRRPGTRDPEGR